MTFGLTVAHRFTWEDPLTIQPAHGGRKGEGYYRVGVTGFGSDIQSHSERVMNKI